MRKHYLSFIFCLLFCSSGFAQPVTVTLGGTPLNTTGWTYGGGGLSGSTDFPTIAGNAITLDHNTNGSGVTNGGAGAGGYIYNNTAVDLAAMCNEFSVGFDFQVTPSSPGGPVADGFTFYYITNPPATFWNAPNPPPIDLGWQYNEYLNMPSNPVGAVLVFDFFANITTPPPLITLLGGTGTNFSVYQEGTMAGNGQIGTLAGAQSFIIDGTWHHCNIIYNNGVWNVYFDGSITPLITGNFTLAPGAGYLGFSASMGGITSQTSIRNFVATNVAPPPTVTPPLLCQNGPSSPLTATGVNSSATFTWFDASLNQLPTAPTPSTADAGTTTYYVQQQVSGTCSALYDTVNVTVTPQPAAPVITGDTAYCYGTPPTPFSVAGQGILWYNNDTGSGSATAPVVNTSAPGMYTYYASQTVNGCQSPIDSISVNVKPVTPVPAVDSVVSYCQYDPSVSLQGDVNGQGLLWYTNPPSGPGSPTAPVPSTLVPDTTAFYVSQTINNCESDSVPVSVVVIQKPNLLFNISDTQICLFNTSTLTYTGDASSFAQFNWTLPANTSLISGNGPGPLVIQFNAAGVSQVNFNVVDYGCSSDDTTLNINVIKSPAPTINYPKDVCYGQPATIYFNDTSATSGSDIYYWGWDGGTVSDGSNSGPYAVTWYDEGDHIISLSVVVNSCASDTTKDTIHIQPLPDVQIAPLPSNDVCAGDSLLLQASATVPVYAYQWSPYNYFQTDNNKAAVYGIIDTPGYVYVRAISTYGCVNTDSVLLTTHPCCDVVLPNAFTPNHDGHNDVFRIIGLHPQKVVEFRIFDRWGKIVYNATDEKGWDGTTNGTAVPIDTYYYTLTYVCNDGREYHKKGDVTVIR